jgi:hypothetical protein
MGRDWEPSEEGREFIKEELADYDEAIHGDFNEYEAELRSVVRQVDQVRAAVALVLRPCRQSLY